ncbi:MAG: PfkB family carbohydrate kinase, partial [Thermoflexales bacterium]|nr:PfkB family carbohydrate kinase [Thermoflexales bacterium]
MGEGVLVVGAANFDIKGRMQHSPKLTSSNRALIRTSFGGVARNIAENLARLGVPVTLLTAVGDDYAGEDLLDSANEVGVDVSRALVVEGEITGTYLAVLDEGGDLFIGLDDLRVLRHVTPEYLQRNEDVFRGCALVALDLNLSEGALRTAIHLARAHHKPICIDPTSAMRAPSLRPYLHLVDVVTPNIAEAEALLDESPILTSDDALIAARQLVRRGVKVAVITQAERGACYAT